MGLLVPTKLYEPKDDCCFGTSFLPPTYSTNIVGHSGTKNPNKSKPIIRVGKMGIRKLQSCILLSNPDF